MTHKYSKPIVKRIEHIEARIFLGNYELLGNMGLGVWHYGLYVDSLLSSVVSFGTTSFSPKRGFLSQIAASAGCHISQLCRGATAPWASRNSPSQLISSACKLLYHSRGAQIIVAYANPELREVGTIYQACNALYLGMTDPKSQANYLIHGQLMSGWMVRKKYGTRSRNKLKEIDPCMIIYPLNPKHRYLLFACSRRKKIHLRRLLKPYTFRYPKNVQPNIDC